MSIETCNAIYVAKPDYIHELCAELGDSPEVIGNLVFSKNKKLNVCFALDIWLEPKIVSFQSISEAARILRQAGKYWYLNPISHVRRSNLITSELRKLPGLTHEFPITEPIPPIGCFSLLDQNTLVFSYSRFKKPPMGDFQFIEDKVNPPNRAYLKLWEALSLLENPPVKGEIAVDLGASPGGWTYVMQSLGVQVTAMDKAPLAKHIADLPGVRFQQQSAFAFLPEHVSESLDWLLSDVACYPDRLYDYACKWIASGKARNIIFTLKLQGDTDLEIIRKFQSIPNAFVLQLFYNKHEATFFYPGFFKE